MWPCKMNVLCVWVYVCYFQCVNKLVYVLTWLELKISRLTSVLMSTHKLLLPNKSLCLHLVNSSTRPYQSPSEGYVLSLCDAPG